MEARDGYGKDQDVREAIRYTVEEQGEPMEVFAAHMF